MRMIPTVVRSATRSQAERRVFELLKNTDLGANAHCVHSLNIAEHEYKMVGELDFVILCPRGLLVLEVKGGGVESRGGIWHFTDRFGMEHRRSEGPFQQARSGMFSLRDRLARELGEAAVSGITFGYGVIFTDCDFTERSVEWSDEMVIDRGGLRGRRDLGPFVTRLLRYWANRRAGGFREAAEDMLERVAALLRPEFDKVPPLSHRAEQIDLAMECLTADQYGRLDLIEENPRILCTGGAGTGKTFLAAELARRHAARGERVLVACPGGILAAFLRSRLPEEEISVQVVGPSRPVDGDYDVLILDEGQDVLDFETLDQLDRCLKGGLERGIWRIFHDPNKQTGLVGSFDPNAVEMLRSYGAVSATLRVNCRNTKQIATHTRLLTAADLGSPTAGDGPQVGIVFVSDEAQEAALVDEHLRKLSDQGVSQGDITILSPVSLASSCARLTRVAARGRLRVLDEAAASSWPLARTTFATIPEFKGLENRFILLVDIHAFDESERDLNLLYVAMSRARAGLWMTVHERLRSRIDHVARANLPLVIRDLPGDQHRFKEFP